MKYRRIHIIEITLSMALLLLLTGCSQDSPQQREEERPMRNLNLVLGGQSYSDIVESPSRRALPSGYTVYDDLSPQMALEDIRIRVFVTQDGDVYPKYQGDFFCDKQSTPYVWTSPKVPIDVGTYYIYGFMPSTEISKAGLAPETTANLYSKGAQMTLNDLPAVILYDPCVIVGVKGKKTSTASITSLTDLKLGSFSYNVDDDGEYLYVLLNHLYACLDFRMDIDESYNKLRSVKVTKVELKPADEWKSVNVTATLTPNTSNSSPLSLEYAVSTGTTSGFKTLYDQPSILMDSKETNYQTVNFITFVAPCAKNKKFLLQTTYNVYDKEDNLIRENCTASNLIQLPDVVRDDREVVADRGRLLAGEKYTFKLTVTPTYLYVLSDPDLDNPTVKVN